MLGPARGAPGAEPRGGHHGHPGGPGPGLHDQPALALRAEKLLLSDLPKGYQISQFEEPVCSGGTVEIEVEGRVKKVRLNRIHMEEDAGKLVHVGAPGIWGSKASAVDFNRSSVPLVEIVSETGHRHARRGAGVHVMLRAVLVSLGICNGNMEEGNLRCDANVSLREKGETALGVKVEVKNMNSLKAIERAIAFEISRIEQMLRAGQQVTQETRLWDESGQKTYLMRSKEESHDYRYFPDPDLLPLEVSDEWKESLKSTLPPMPLERKKRYERDFSFNESEARLFMVNPGYAGFFEKALAITTTRAPWPTGSFQSYYPTRTTLRRCT